MDCFLSNYGTIAFADVARVFSAALLQRSGVAVGSAKRLAEQLGLIGMISPGISVANL